MLTVRLHGHLEEKFGSEFYFEAATVREVIDALQANFDDFTEEFIKDERAYNILVDAEAQEVGGCVVPIKTDSTIDIIPIIGGAGFLKALGLIIVGALLVIAAPYAAGALFQAGLIGAGSVTGLSVAAVAGGIQATVAAIGWGLALAGVASLLAGPDGPDGGGPKSSSLSQMENIVGQGMPVPIGYGRLLLGSIVLSSTATSSYIKTSYAYTYATTPTSNWSNYRINVGKYLNVSAFNNSTDPQEPTYNPQVTYDGGWTSDGVFSQAVSEADSEIGKGSFELVNYTPISGVTLPIPVFVAPVITGGFTSDFRRG